MVTCLQHNSPGNSPGTLTFANTSLTVGTDAKYVFEVAGSGVDRIAFSGATSGLSITGAWTLQVIDLGFGDPTGRTFILFDGVVGAPDLNGGLVGSPTVDLTGTSWSGTPVVNFDAANNDIILTGAVPEPAAVTLLLGGLITLAGARRRRQG